MDPYTLSKYHEPYMNYIHLCLTIIWTDYLSAEGQGDREHSYLKRRCFTLLVTLFSKLQCIALQYPKLIGLKLVIIAILPIYQTIGNTHTLKLVFKTPKRSDNSSKL